MFSDNAPIQYEKPEVVISVAKPDNTPFQLVCRRITLGYPKPLTDVFKVLQ